jgi:hypothetical protein
VEFLAIAKVSYKLDTHDCLLMDVVYCLTMLGSDIAEQVVLKKLARRIAVLASEKLGLLEESTDDVNAHLAFRMTSDNKDFLLVSNSFHVEACDCMASNALVNQDFDLLLRSVEKSH